jgi:trk system potassium uptake protein TrkA
VLFKKLGIDVTISSTNLILEHIEEELPINPLVHLLTLKEGNLELVEVKVPEGSPAVGKKLSEINLPPNSMVVMIIGKGSARVPTSETVIKPAAQIIAMTQPEVEQALRVAFTG